MRDGQQVGGGLLTLERLGVTEIGTDRLRQVGRGEREETASVDQLCGNCASGRLAVAADGTVWPCVFSRWLPVGNVVHQSLMEILAGKSFTQTVAVLEAAFADRAPAAKCKPDNEQKCGPDTRCSPSTEKPCQPNCPPGMGAPPKRCWPYYYEDQKR